MKKMCENLMSGGEKGGKRGGKYHHHNYILPSTKYKVEIACTNHQVEDTIACTYYQVQDTN